MNIAIRGHQTRGKEIIQILESLGGINRINYCGDCINYFYYIRGDYNTIEWTYIPPEYFKVYTLEEFEKDFPFKIGDKVTIIGLPDFPKVITQMVWDCDEILYSFEGLNNTWFGTKSLKKFEMKEERNITLTLDKAKEWYKKGGELKEVALQAYSEKELNPLPKSWIEFAKSTKFTFNGSLQYITGDEYLKNGCFPNKSIGESSKIWHKYVALFQLEQLRDCWRQGWVPDWNDSRYAKHCIVYNRGFFINTYHETRRFLSFPTKKMAEEFLECFRDLIEKAGDLI